MSLIICEIELDLSWSRNCVTTEILRTYNPVWCEVTLQATSGTFQINNTKLYVPVATLSINDNIKFLENIKQGFKRTISWNKYRS